MEEAVETDVFDVVRCVVGDDDDDDAATRRKNRNI